MAASPSPSHHDGPYPLSNWTFHYLLSFGRYVEVLEPAIARRLLRERALEIAALYKA